MPVGLFGSKDNARNFRNWQYAPIATECDATEAMIACASAPPAHRPTDRPTDDLSLWT